MGRLLVLATKCAQFLKIPVSLWFMCISYVCFILIKSLRKKLAKALKRSPQPQASVRLILNEYLLAQVKFKSKMGQRSRRSLQERSICFGVRLCTSLASKLNSSVPFAQVT